MVWRALGRLILIPLGLALAISAAFAVAFSLGLEKITQSMHGSPEGLETIDAYVGMAFDALTLLGGLTIVPALLVVVIGEVARIRSWLYYVVGGGLALGTLPLIARMGGADAATPAPAALWQVLATAGFAGGFVYWLVAGRRA